MVLSQPTVSVIVPLFNGERFIRQALDSIRTQTHQVHEIIVVDDGSTDSGADIVSSASSNCRLSLLRQTNAGQAAARNAGIACSTGNLIAFLDQDDVWYPDHIEALIQPFLDDRSGAMGWAYGDVDQISESGQLRVRCVVSTLQGEHPKTRLDSCLGCDILALPSASVLSRSAFDAVGGFDEQLRLYEADDLFLRIFTAGYRNVFIDRPLGQQRACARAQSYSHEVTERRMMYARKLLAAYPDDPNQGLHYTRDFVAPRFLSVAINNVRQAIRSGADADVDPPMQDVDLLRGYCTGAAGTNRRLEDFLITAIIPLYNGAPYIREAIGSVFGQTLVPDEVIVVDDGSTDTGPALVDDLAKIYPIRLLRKVNGGQSSARNFGVEHSHGDLIAFLDQDDAWYPNHLAELIQPFLESRPLELGWVYSNLDEIGKDGDLINRGFLSLMPVPHPKRSLSACLGQDMFILPSASLISRKAFKQVGGFDERLSGYEDDDLFLRLFQSGLDHVYLPKSLSKWRIHQSSSSYSIRMAISRATYARMLIARFPDDPDNSRYYTKDLIAPRFFRLMSTELRKAVIKGTKDQRRTALANLSHISGYLRPSRRVPVRMILLPLLRIPPVARFLLEHRLLLVAVARRFFPAL